MRLKMFPDIEAWLTILIRSTPDNGRGSLPYPIETADFNGVISEFDQMKYLYGQVIWTQQHSALRATAVSSLEGQLVPSQDSVKKPGIGQWTPSDNYRGGTRVSCDERFRLPRRHCGDVKTLSHYWASRATNPRDLQVASIDQLFADGQGSNGLQKHRQSTVFYNNQVQLQFYHSPK